MGWGRGGELSTAPEDKVWPTLRASAPLYPQLPRPPKLPGPVLVLTQEDREEGPARGSMLTAVPFSSAPVKVHSGVAAPAARPREQAALICLPGDKRKPSPALPLVQLSTQKVEGASFSH